MTWAGLGGRAQSRRFGCEEGVAGMADQGFLGSAAT